MVEGPLDPRAVGVGVDPQLVRHVDATDPQDAVLDLDLAAADPDQPSFARGDLARLQRASEGSGQSAGSGGDDVVERRGPLDVAAPRDAVVVGDLVVDAEPDRLGRPRDVGPA